MKKLALSSGLFVLLFLFSCTENKTETGAAPATAEPKHSPSGLTLQLQNNPEWQYENLRLYPITADGKILSAHAALTSIKTVEDAMETPGFRITEKKQFGSRPDTWYNALTVQNKSRDTIFLMSGDVVQGGNQDRVIAHDDIVLPASLKNIEVFCVEHGRSSYYNPQAPEEEKRVAAFRGYYNVASPQVRHAIHSGNQQGVWDAVEHVTTENKAESDTKAYAGLEIANDEKAKREEYLRFFDGKFLDRSDIVGVVAVSNGTIMGVDIFGNPALFRQKFNSLLHGYVAEAAVGKPSGTALPDAAVRAVFDEVARQADTPDAGSAATGRFGIGTQWVHLFSK